MPPSANFENRDGLGPSGQFDLDETEFGAMNVGKAVSLRGKVTEH